MEDIVEARAGLLGWQKKYVLDLVAGINGTLQGEGLQERLWSYMREAARKWQLHREKTPVGPDEVYSLLLWLMAGMTDLVDRTPSSRDWDEAVRDVAKIDRAANELEKLGHKDFPELPSAYELFSEQLALHLMKCGLIDDPLGQQTVSNQEAREQTLLLLMRLIVATVAEYGRVKQQDYKAKSKSVASLELLLPHVQAFISRIPI